MPTILIGRKHRADHDSELAWCGLSSYTAVIDAQPNVRDRNESDLVSAAQCAVCNFVDFLSGLDELQKYQGLSQIRGFFRELPRLIRACSERNSESIETICASLGATQCVQIQAAGHARWLTGFPSLHVVDGRASAPAFDQLRHGDWVLIEPSKAGPRWLGDCIATAAARGVKKVFVGYHKHAAAVEQWSDFVERPGFIEAWLDLLVQTNATLSGSLGMLIAYPPCASLQWRPNLALEQLRARLDLQFRMMDDQASKMCPENVSGYGLTHDVRPLLSRTQVVRRTLAIRYDDILFLFGHGV